MTVSSIKSSFKSRTTLIGSLLLLLLVGVLLWFLFTSQPASNSAPDTTSNTSLNTSEAISSGAADQDIAVIRAQLELEKANAEKVRMQLRMRQQQAQQTRLAVAEPEPELDRDQQKQRIAEMIAAQLKGTEEKNQQLSQALKQKEQELATIKARNKELQDKIEALDDSTRSLLAALDPGRDISDSDQSYIQVLQGGADDSGTTATTKDVDLINRIEVSDTQDAGSVTAQLRNQIKQLMQEDEDSGPAPDTTSPTANPTADDLQSTIDSLFDNHETRAAERAAKKQFLADSQYLESLDPIEEERSNETRWVTVREGDTLSKIAIRVYDNVELYTKIHAANPQVLSNPDLIRAGQRLRVPR